MTRITMQSDKNFAKSGEVIQVQVQIDNRQGSSTIKGGKIIFEERKTKYYNGMPVQDLVNRTWPMCNLPSKVERGQVINSNLTLIIPQ